MLTDLIFRKNKLNDEATASHTALDASQNHKTAHDASIRLPLESTRTTRVSILGDIFASDDRYTYS